MAKRHLVPGFYIAECDLLRPLYKVGHTGDLRERLHDSAYVTCFPPNSWRFVATLELPTKEAAAEVECGILVHFQKNRLGSSELVQVTLAELLNLAQKLVELLSYPLILKRAPVYERPAAPKSKTLAKTKTEPMVAKMKLLLETALAPLVPANYQDNLPTSVSEEDAADELNLIEAELTSDKLVLREYQQEAATAITAELTKNRRAILQMACRCGKTPVAFTTAQMIGLPVLFLVPGLALLRQTAQKIYHYAGGRINLLLVGSDQQEVKLKNCSLGMTTNDQVIMAFMQKTVDSKLPNWVISTYQSSALLTPHIKEFGLIIYDEAHRICGSRVSRPFNEIILACQTSKTVPPVSFPQQLFMTATPIYDAITPNTITMRDREMFGGVANRYYLRQGINAGYVNNFCLELVAVDLESPEMETDTAMAKAIVATMSKVEKMLVFCRDIAHADALCAMTQKEISATAFATSCVHSRMPPGAAQIALQEFTKPGVRSALFNCRMLQEGVEVPALTSVFFAAPRHSPRDIIQSLCRPLNPLKGKPISRIFIPLMYDGKSPVDAPVNLKRYSSILPFIDALLDEDPLLFDALIGASNDLMTLSWVASGNTPGNTPGDTPAPTLMGSAQASLSNTPPNTPPNTLPNTPPITPPNTPPNTPHLLTAGPGCPRLAACRRVIRHGVAGAALIAGRRPERLLRADSIPWNRAFAELRRVVLECRRYPKTTDEWIFTRIHNDESSSSDSSAGKPQEVRVNLHAIYASIATKYNQGELEPYQRTDLESLPGWLPWGADGPYAWAPCMEFLEKWLTENGIEQLALEINKGGYVGLEATPMERLAGALTCVNQQVFGKRTKGPDGRMVVHAANRVPADHAADLDRICGRFGLRWRKQFKADGTVDPAFPTFIQEAYSRFKKMYQEGGSRHQYIQTHYPGYPMKHAQQCALDLRSEDALAALPPRRARKIKK